MTFKNMTFRFFLNISYKIIETFSTEAKCCWSSRWVFCPTVIWRDVFAFHPLQQVIEMKSIYLIKYSMKKNYFYVFEEQTESVKTFFADVSETIG